MKLSDVIRTETILMDLSAKEKVRAIQELAEPAAKTGNVRLEEMIRVILERERLGSTGIGKGIAIPHGKLKGLREPILGFGISRNGVDFDSIDGLPVHLFFLLITPENAPGTHIKLLSQIAKMMKNELVKNRLLQAQDARQVIDVLRAEEEPNP
ncbi:MAG: PTS sugar transporter subunit IIA [Thermodesulfobacteriota bacterium]